MRTFPKELAEFRRVVNARGTELRLLSRQDLMAVGNRPIEHLVVEGRPATIEIIVEAKAEGTLRVVVQGFMPSRLFPFIKNVAFDGFYMRSNGCVEVMPDDELD